MPGTERWIVLCGSMSMHARMLEEKQYLEEAGVTVILPPAEDPVMPGLGEEEYQAVKRKAALAHFRKVMDPKTFAVLAVNADKHGVRDYLDPNTFAEVAVAFALGKRIYLLQNVPRNLEDELRAWGAVPLRGQLDRLIDDYFHACCQTEGTPAPAPG
ncbi:MAG: hypothetical protein WB773_14575 [Isosphaeraceae bacterium]|jgi:nucleoside 2-deoxyribosyltransferase